MKTVVITGATSFIGVNLIPKLLQTAHVIYAFVRKGSNKRKLLPIHEHLHIIEVDICDYMYLDTMIPSCDIFFSMAWDGTRGALRDNRDLQQKNLQYSLDGLNSVLRLNPKMVVSAGSQAEYGLCYGLTDENAPEVPVTEYGKAKLEFYQKAQELCKIKEVSFKEPRFFSLYGKGDFEGTMVVSMLQRMLHNEQCDLTECSQIWDFMNINDAVNALCKMITQPCQDGVYNFGSGIAKPLREFVEEMYNLTHSKSKLQFGAIPYPSTGIVNVHPDISKLCSQLKFKPEVDFKRGILEIVEEMNHEEN